MKMVDLKLKLNTKNGSASFGAGPIIGRLDALIFDSKVKVELIIKSVFGYDIYHNNHVLGSKYIALRSRVSYPIENLKDQMQESGHFMLEEELEITLIGPPNVDLDLILRYDDGI